MTRHCVILSGGASTRFGPEDKAFAPLGGTPLIEHVINQLTSQTQCLAVNSHNHRKYRKYNLPVLNDEVGQGHGPLAGILTAMRWGQDQGQSHVFTVAADTPFIPRDLLVKLDNHEGDVVLAAAGGRIHPICGRWSCALSDSLEEKLVHSDLRAVRAFSNLFRTKIVEFTFNGQHDPFFNINTFEDLRTAEAMLRRDQTLAIT